MQDTRAFANDHRGKSMNELPELLALVEQVSTDPIRWRTVYRCRTSGELWEEIYEATGHGEIPIVTRDAPVRRHYGGQRFEGAREAMLCPECGPSLAPSFEYPDAELVSFSVWNPYD
jgi:hypothetical protein